MKVESILFSVFFLEFLHVLVVKSSPISLKGIVDGISEAQLKPNLGTISLIDPIKFVKRTRGRIASSVSTNSSATTPETITTTNSFIPKSTTHSPGLRSLSHAEPELNEVETENNRSFKITNEKDVNSKNPFDKFLTDDLTDRAKHYKSHYPHPHSRSKRALIFFLIKKLIKFKFLLLG